MNVFDIFAIVIFALFVIICTFRGFLKILSKWGAVFAAIILSKIFGARVGDMLFSEVPVVNSFSNIIGTMLLFVVIFFLCRIILGALAKLITNVLNATAIDKVLGAIIGAIGGTATLFLFAFLSNILVLVVSFFSPEANIINMVNEAYILKYFMIQ